MSDDALVQGTENFYLSIVSVDSGDLLFPRTARIDVIDDEQPETLDPVPPLVSDYTVTETVIYSGLVRPLAFEFSPVDSTKMYVATNTGSGQAVRHRLADPDSDCSRYP